MDGDLRISPSRRATVIGVAGLLLFGNIILGSFGSVAQGSPASAGRIAFVSARDGDYDVYVREANGTVTGPLWDTDSGGSYPGTAEYDPEWSPDGTQLVFSSNKDGDFEIYLMNPDGSGVRRLTNNGGFDRDPTWAPDGNSIVFAASDNPYDEDLSIMHRDALSPTGWSSPEILMSRPLSDRTPEFSPDGTKIAFAGDATASDFRFNIYVMDSDGSDVVQLAGAAADEVIPTWSPDGLRIAFTSTRSGRNSRKTTVSGVWIMNANGSDQRRVTPENTYEFYPDWSPDGTHIAVQGRTSKNGYEVYTRNLTTGTVTLVATSPAFDGMPDW
jgi:Tol biopolymer transport system component